MKIVFIITDYGGFNNFLGELARKLVLNKNEVHVICDKEKVINFEDKFPYLSLGIHIHHVNFLRSLNLNVLSWLKTSARIKKIISEIEPDIVNLHFTTSIFLSLLSGRIKFPTIGVFHGLGYPVLTSPLKKYIFKKAEFFCFKRLDHIGLINNFDYDLVKKFFPEKAFKFKSFGVGCDLNKFNINNFSLGDKNALKEKLNIQPADFVLMYTGRFVHFKGFDLVIKAFKYIEEKGLIKNIKLILAGGKDSAHSTGLNHKEEYYLQNAKNIINIGFTERVDKYLSISDLFVFPSSKEGVPVGIMEAVAMGVPVITINSRGCSDVIKHNYNGKLLDARSDFKAIAMAVVELHSNQQELELFSKNALAQRTDFDRDLFIKESIELFKHFTRLSPAKK